MIVHANEMKICNEKKFHIFYLHIWIFINYIFAKMIKIIGKQENSFILFLWWEK